MFLQLKENIHQRAHHVLNTLLDRIHQIDLYLEENPWNQPEIDRNSIIRYVQERLREFVESSEHLIVHFELEIPPYNDCDEFRLTVQNEILDDLVAMKTTQINALNHLLDYREQRALAKKASIKHPQFDDNEHLIRFLDEQIFRQTRLFLLDLRSSLFRQCHLIKKNHFLIEHQSSSHPLQNYF